MSKFCGNCGTMMDDSAAVCGNCGTPLSNNAQPANKANPLEGVLKGVKNGNKNTLIKGGIAAVVAVVVLVLIISLFSGGSDKAVKKLIKAYDKENAAAIVKLTPEFMINYAEDIYGSWGEEYDAEKEIEKEIESFYEMMEEEDLEGNLKFSYKIKDEDKLDKDDLEDVAEEMEAMFDDFDEKKLKAAVEYEVDVTVKAGGEKENLDLEVYVIKYGGKWYVFSYEWDY